MQVTADCQLCKQTFEQDTKRGRPFRFCEVCRKLLWFEKKAKKAELENATK